jgi:hypothetical protein
MVRRLAIRTATAGCFRRSNIVARERGATADEAAKDATLYIEGTRERVQV